MHPLPSLYCCRWVAAFKPRDEEPFAPLNPKKFQGKLGQQGIRKGLRSGEAYLREVAACLLDQVGACECMYLCAVLDSSTSLLSRTPLLMFQRR